MDGKTNWNNRKTKIRPKVNSSAEATLNYRNTLDYSQSNDTRP